ncbi:hypothetical protein IscW_ISCW012717 [Ixodes scapularis]|uniref:Uncharacterized protein n=1 Tax=Ixodes scapularis TaxID=6945 RepID=B7QBL6_IXOSC|nr:hypothetical protein IscW_ISCW012717 [Ixodes scapularis]|eukprot:XP_002412942.1 hypothetical protein IscW_ISCW012717 [Ixodes scapularis]
MSIGWYSSFMHSGFSSDLRRADYRKVNLQERKLDPIDAGYLRAREDDRQTAPPSPPTSAADRCYGRVPPVSREVAGTGERMTVSLSLAVASKNSEEPPPVARGGAWRSASESFQCPRLVSCHEGPVECPSAVCHGDVGENSCRVTRVTLCPPSVCQCMASSGRLSNGAAMVAQGKLRATSSEDGKEDDDDCRSPLLEDFEMIKTIGELCRGGSGRTSRGIRRPLCCFRTEV